MKLIDGKALAETIKDKIASEIHSLSGPRPGLAIILVGNRPDSALYVGRKEKQAKTVGIDTHVYRCEEDTPQDDIIKMINFLNNDDAVDAILVQLPLPAHLDTDAVVNTIAPEKDVDGFTRANLEKLMDETHRGSAILPPVYAVILTMLQSINCELEGKHIILLANSDIFVDNLAEVLRRQGATVTLGDSNDPNVGDITRQGDIVISAIGKAHYITGDLLKDNAVVIDIGISMNADNLPEGDVDFESVQNKVSYITPVPGGVGPMTIAMAFWNTLEMFKKRHAK